MDKNHLLETARKLEQVNILILVKLSDQDMEAPNSLH